MHPSARIIMMLLLIGLGLTTPDSSGSSKPMLGAAQQRATTPDGASGQEASTPPQSSSNPDASGIYHGGRGVSPPLIIYSVDPEMTDKARQRKLSGTCIVSMVVDTKGNPQDVHVVRSIASTVSPKLRSAAMGLDENAINVAKQYKLKPGTDQGNLCPSRSRSK